MGTSGTLLVTGASGRLGRALRLLWNPRVCGLDLHWSSRAESLGDVPWHIGHSLPPSCLEGAVVLHLAAVLRGDSAELARNATMATALCRAAQAAGARHILLASTAAVYRPGPDDLDETDVPAPANPYGAAKLAAEQAAVAALTDPGSPGLTILRVGNVAGADALLGGQGPALLDPVQEQTGGPLRSYIGPVMLAQVLAHLAARGASGAAIPPILNIAQPPVVAMADLLSAAGRPWRYGPVQPGVVPRVGLATHRLAALMPLPTATAAGIVADLASLKDRWP